MAISTNGTFINNLSGTSGQTSAPLTTTAVGDAVVLGVTVQNYNTTVSALSGGGADSSGWSQLVSPLGTAAVGFSMNFWWCRVGTTGSVTLTLTFAGTAIGTTLVNVAGQEFSGGFGPNTRWVTDGASSTNQTTNSTTLAFPSRTATFAAELYFGYVVPMWTGSAGSTSGFTYQVNASNDVHCWNPNASGTLSPTASQNISGNYLTASALFIARNGAQTPPTNRARLIRSSCF